MRARARCNELFTAATLPSSASAVSLADQPNTSRRISAARGRGGRYWIAARKASSIVSLATTTASGSSSPDATFSSRRSGYGCSHGTSSKDGPRSSSVESSTTRTLRRLRLMASRQAFVAIRYSQARNVDRPSNPERFAQARARVSWTRSSASSKLPSIR